MSGQPQAIAASGCVHRSWLLPFSLAVNHYLMNFRNLSHPRLRPAAPATKRQALALTVLPLPSALRICPSFRASDYLCTARQPPPPIQPPLPGAVWELWTGLPAFHGLHFGQICENVVVQGLRPEVPEGMPEDYSRLMQGCWQQEPQQRPSMAQVVQRLGEMLEACSGGAHSSASLALVLPSSGVGSATQQQQGGEEGSEQPLHGEPL